MSCSSSSYTAHDASESGYTASLSRQPIQDSEEDPSEDEVNSIHSPTATPTLVPSLPTCQGPPFRQTARIRVISLASASDRYSLEHLMDHPRHPTRPRPDNSRYPHMVTGVPVSHESGMTLEDLDRMQYLCGEESLVFRPLSGDTCVGISVGGSTHVQTRGCEAALQLTWEEFKKLLLKEYCPKSKVQKLELEFWNHAMVGSDVDKYTS
ncbi:hypothetical protein Tco_0859257 [Tanacetum coccineum]|uniref:Retrotransposon gag domain-containing protein n=1 Tax=Tanacetum coccineum TaxID=301880 RepID=A0ABQ5BBL6_9ASTR